MSRAARVRLFWAAALLFAAGYAVACLELPPLGGPFHPYGERAVAAALGRRTANTVSSVNFDLRGFDTLGEEFVLFTAALGAVLLLRRTRDEHVSAPRPGRVLPTVRLAGTVLLPVVLVTGVSVVAHGQLTPGGGFQGGVVLATGLHLAYLAADYRVLRRVRPRAVLEVAEAVAAGGFALLGLIGLVRAGAFLENVLPLGTFGELASGGQVPVLNASVGLEVASALVVVLAGFIDQALEIES
ncbi:sodium:proton antiporter [Streptomyces sp. SKN60]|uniref:MnhB domain-containing protein n=1 Tax=Streptomyces sp. SKN60 TaxID=2855506 RepID=UPI002247371C|nr:MnhB domain-containing protein [Streptomyces sp. SKN60]MCX2180584.1 sodium:proton antiporter [Streptomyces sp. SKN60]